MKVNIVIFRPLTITDSNTTKYKIVLFLQLKELRRTLTPRKVKNTYSIRKLKPKISKWGMMERLLKLQWKVIESLIVKCLLLTFLIVLSTVIKLMRNRRSLNYWWRIRKVWNSKITYVYLHCHMILNLIDTITHCRRIINLPIKISFKQTLRMIVNNQITWRNHQYSVKTGL